MRSQPSLLAMSIAALLLAGCSVTPEPIHRQEVISTIEEDRGLIYASQESLDGPIDLAETMARALKYNLDHRVQLVQEALSSRSFDLVKLDMLPLLSASVSRVERDNVNASRSLSILTGRESLEPSTSQDQKRSLADMRFAWNILDFGISYLQAKQESDRFLITRMGRRDVMVKLLQQARTTFWRAAAMQQVAFDLDATLKRSREALDALRKVRDEQLRTPISTLQDLRTMVEIVQQLEQMQQSVNQARVELALLINEPPSSKLLLDLPETLPQLPMELPDLDEMELAALANSATYVGELYNARIDQIESRKAMLRLLPGLEFGYTFNYDSNSYLVNNQWREASLRLTGNLLRLTAWQRTQLHNEARDHLAMARRLAMNMTVVTKLHLAWQEYRNSISRLERARELDQVDRDIRLLTEQSVASNASSGIEEIQSQARALRSAMAGLLAYADAQDAFGKMVVSLAINPGPDNYQQLGVDQLTRLLATTFADWEQGNFPLETGVSNPSEEAVIDGRKSGQSEVALDGPSIRLSSELRHVDRNVRVVPAAGLPEESGQRVLQRRLSSEEAEKVVSLLLRQEPESEAVSSAGSSKASRNPQAIPLATGPFPWEQ